MIFPCTNMIFQYIIMIFLFKKIFPCMKIEILPKDFHDKTEKERPNNKLLKGSIKTLCFLGPKT